MRPRTASMTSVMMDQRRARAFRQFALRTTSFTAQGFIRPVPRLSGLKGLDARFLGVRQKVFRDRALSCARGGVFAGEPIINVRDLKKHYADIKAVDGITFDVEKGAMFSLLGPNGAGKTTTVEILEGLRDPTSGEARVLGVDVRTDYRKIRDRVGILPQDFEPFDRLQPREAVAYWAQLFDRTMTKKEIDDILRTVGLTDRADTLAMNLSGGEKRRLGIAMSLVGRPALVFLDEPTTGLDPSARRELWALIRQLKKEGTTILLTTHYLDEAEQLADDVAIMNHGKIVARGSPAELIAQYGQGHSIVLAGAGEEGLKAVRARGVTAELPRVDVVVQVPLAIDLPGHPDVGRLLPVHPRTFDQRRPLDSRGIPTSPIESRERDTSRRQPDPCRRPDPIVLRRRRVRGRRGRDGLQSQGRESRARRERPADVRPGPPPSDVHRPLPAGHHRLHDPPDPVVRDDGHLRRVPLPRLLQTPRDDETEQG